jgi:hypothetical protein
VFDGAELMTASGAVWVDQFYDYWDDGTAYDPRPGRLGRVYARLPF